MFSRFQPYAFALLRIIAGVMFAMHGSQKLLGWPGASRGTLPPLIFTAGVLELVGGILIAVGLFTSLAAFICSGLMAAAYFIGHSSGGFLPIVNKGELAALYSFLFLFIATWGGGIWSVDALRSGRTSAER